jgi:membrane complex biogenesis BtpA family protein
VHVHPAQTAAVSLESLPRPWLIGVIHLPALPGAPSAALTVGEIADRARADALTLQTAGFGAVMLENFHDTPFRPDGVDPETVAAMAVVARGVRDEVDMAVGVNVLRNDAFAALAVAVAADCSFLRVNVLAGAAVTDQGLVQGRADELMRKRAQLGPGVSVLADVDVKHATSLDDRPAPERARELIGRAHADAVLVTGSATGSPCDLDQLAAVRDVISPAPVLAASGTTADSLPEVLARCDGVVVGTAIKDPATGRVCPDRAAAYCDSRAP